MNLKYSVGSAELQFKQILEDFFITNYDEKSLYSHGIEHHRRVWNNARELLLIRFEPESEISEKFPSKLIIASYLHDIGMSVDSGIRHGKHSRKLCIDFLTNNNLPVGEYEDLLETIEHHDRKEYPGDTDVNELLSILSVADDLDAFGFTGIYRYSEIYLIRGIKPDQIGRSIIENASKRFDHFEKIFYFNISLVQKHRDRFNILIRFFTEYNEQVTSYHFDSKNPEGYCGVIELFINMITDKSDLKRLLMSEDILPDDQVIQWFFNGLRSELF
jgi:HD superfamily phosphodiesterase